MTPEINRLAPKDARILRLETSAIAGHTCKVAVVEPGPDGRISFDELSDQAMADCAPRCRQRVAFTPLGLGAPRVGGRRRLRHRPPRCARGGVGRQAPDRSRSGFAATPAS